MYTWWDQGCWYKKLRPFLLWVPPTYFPSTDVLIFYCSFFFKQLIFIYICWHVTVFFLLFSLYYPCHLVIHPLLLSCYFFFPYWTIAFNTWLFSVGLLGFSTETREKGGGGRRGEERRGGNEKIELRRKRLKWLMKPWDCGGNPGKNCSLSWKAICWQNSFSDQTQVSAL